MNEVIVSEMFERWVHSQNDLLELKLPDLAESTSLITRYYATLSAENAQQNLTRLTEPLDYLEGHVLDVLHLQKSGFLRPDTSRPFDLGSGGGIPGILHAILFGRAWVVCDAEKSKARFLGDVIRDYSLVGSESVDSRAEEWLSTHEVSQICVRAVGKVAKLYGWLQPCSTWNQMILFKGPNWKQEWKEFQVTSQRNRLRISGEYSYRSGEKERVLVLLDRT